MLRAFKERRPWAAALVSLVLGPVLGMLYLNRGRNAIIYLVVLIVLSSMGLSRIVLPHSEYLWFLSSPEAWAVAAIGVVHSYVIARRRSTSESLHWYARWYCLLPIFLVLTVCVFVTGERSSNSYYISSGSMLPTLAPNDRILVSKSIYRNSLPRRGDIVVFHVPNNYNQVYIKRIIGIPGDRVQFVGGRVYVDGKAARLHFLRMGASRCMTCAPSRLFEETVPGTVSHDILVDDETASAENTGVYIVPADSYLLVGDNRDESMDSRFPELGYVSRRAIIGRAIIKYFDGARNRWAWQTIR